MRSFLKPTLLVILAVNFVLLLTTVGADRGNTSASELFPSFSRSYDLGDLLLTHRVAALVDHQYVDPTRVHPDAMFESALEDVQRYVPEVLFDYDKKVGSVTIWVDEYSETVQVGDVSTVPSVVAALRKTLVVVGNHWSGESDKLPEIEYAAINGMLQTLDPHSLLLPPDNAKAMDVQIQGEFGGLGITISLRGEEQTLTVISVLDGTPAKRGGLKAGDQILQIDGESTVNLGLNDAVKKLRGLVGAKVEVLIGRQTFESPTVFKIRRDLIKIESVETDYLGDGIGLIKLKAFQHNSYDQLVDGLEEIRSHGPIKGLILDMRNNPGGALQQAIRISDRFIEKGELVTTVHSHTREKETEHAKRMGTEPPYPIAVLMGSSSASASEIVAGALKNNNRAVIVGETSFGKGSVQNLFPNPDDSKLKLTMLQYLTPGDQSIQSVGVAPDIHLAPVFFSDEMVYYYSTAHIFREKDLEEHLDGDPIDYKTQAAPTATIRYFAPEEFVLGATAENDDKESAEEGTEASEGDVKAEAEKVIETFEEDEDKNPLDDFQVQFSKDLLMKAGRGTRKGTLKQANSFLKERGISQDEVIHSEMEKLGVDWTAGKFHGGPVAVTVSHNGENEKALWKAGEEIEFTLTVTNESKRTLHQLRGVSSSDLPLFDQIEFVFGKIEAGASRSWSRTLKLRDNTFSLAEPVTFSILAGENDVVGEQKILVEVRELNRPSLAFSIIPVDDGSGQSDGNGDGFVQPGEVIDLLAIAKNAGEGGSDRAYLRVSNETGRAIYLNKGTANFGTLEPGAVSVQRLNFKVEGAVPEDMLHFDLRAGDAIGLSRVERSIDLPVFPGVKRVVEVEKHPGTLLRDSAIQSASGEDSLRFATLSKGASVIVDGRLSGYYKVRFTLGGEEVPGWLPEDALKLGEGGIDGVVLSEGDVTLSHRAPNIEVQVPAFDLPASLDILHLTGVAEDDKGIHSLYAFVNDKKHYFKSVTSKNVTAYPFELALPLEPGANRVEIWAHDDDGLKGMHYFQVYREEGVVSVAN